MEKFLKEEIYKKIAEGRVCVFPTEESARAFSVQYVMDEKKSIRSSSCISFDTFAEMIYPDNKESKPAGDIEISIFSKWFIGEYADSLKYFYSNSYPEMKEHLPKFISNVIPDLEEAFDQNIHLDARLKFDLELIRNEYIKFLISNKLYQWNYQNVIDGVDISSYYFVAPMAFPKEIKLQRKAKGYSFNTLPADKDSNILNVYENEKEEIRALFTKIRTLFDSGAGMEEIAISTSALGRLKPYLLQEAMLFDISLNFVPGVDVSETLPGKFFSDIYNIYSNGYSSEDMRAFFLNPSMPFKDRRIISDFISKATQFSIASAPDKKNDRYAKLSIDYSLFSYKEFRHSLDGLMKAETVENVRIYFNSLLLCLFGENRFVDNPFDNDVFGFIQDNLKKFLDSYSNAQLNGYRIKEPLFPLFIKQLSTLKYVSKTKVKGVNVYPFTQGAATPYKYHFLITLNEDESKSELKNAGFLSEYEREEFVDEEITSALIDVYSSISENVYLSCSRNTYKSNVLPLVALMDRERKALYDEKDSYIEEDSPERDCPCIYPVQKIGYEKAICSAMRKIERAEFIAPELEEDPTLSFTAVSDYERCHLRYALKNYFGMQNLPLYEISTYDSAEIGSRMHSVLERFDRFTPLESEEKLEVFFDEEMDAWKNGKKYEYDEREKKETLVDMASGSAVPSDRMIMFLKKKYLSNMIKLVKEIREESLLLPDGIELNIKEHFPKYSFNLTGRIDKIARDRANGNLIVYDYKSGREFSGNAAKDKALQFDIYNLLLKSREDFVERGEFVFLASGYKKKSWEATEAGESVAIKRIKAASDGIRKGDWKTSDVTESCKECEFKGICRKRMNIQ